VERVACFKKENIKLARRTGWSGLVSLAVLPNPFLLGHDLASILSRHGYLGMVGMGKIQRTYR